MFKKLFIAIFVLGFIAACSHDDAGKAGAGGPNGTGLGVGGVTSGNVTPGTEDDLVANVGDRVFFDTDSSVLNSDAQATLSKQAQWLQSNSGLNVTVEGHCDERGTREYNLALGERRATAAKNYLVSLGIPATRVTTISYGKEHPEVLGSSEDAWAKNRRGVTVVNP